MKNILQFDLYAHYDETREQFYVHYLNRNYKKEGFRYEGETGIDDLNIELMIYCHVWESAYYLKTLAHIADLLSGKDYDWELKAPIKNVHSFIMEKIIHPLTGTNMGAIIQESYNSDYRNAFAHALYYIVKEGRTIILRNKNLIEPNRRQISFDEFQLCFLKSIVLNNQITNAIELFRQKLCHDGTVTPPIKLPNGKYIQIEAYERVIENERIPLFKCYLVNIRKRDFHVGDIAIKLSNGREYFVLAVEDKGEYEYLTLKGQHRRYISTLFTKKES